jgi:hypothetical protein
MAKPRRSKGKKAKQAVPQIIEELAIDPKRSREEAWRFFEIFEDSRNQNPAEANTKASLCWF